MQTAPDSTESGIISRIMSPPSPNFNPVRQASSKADAEAKSNAADAVFIFRLCYAESLKIIIQAFLTQREQHDECK